MQRYKLYFIYASISPIIFLFLISINNVFMGKNKYFIKITVIINGRKIISHKTS